MQTKVILIRHRRRRLALSVLTAGYLGGAGLLVRDYRVQTRSAPAARVAKRTASTSLELAAHP